MYHLPAQLIKLRSICNVPLSDLSDVQPPKNLDNEAARHGFLKLLRRRSVPPTVKELPKSVTLNAAAWFGFPVVPISPVSLWLTFKDDNGESSVLVDEQQIHTPGSVMLSGSVTLQFVGPVQYIKVSCGGLKDDDRFSVDELYVKRERTDQSVRHVAS